MKRFVFVILLFCSIELMVLFFCLGAAGSAGFENIYSAPVVGQAVTLQLGNYKVMPRPSVVYASSIPCEVTSTTIWYEREDYEFVFIGGENPIGGGRFIISGGYYINGISDRWTRLVMGAQGTTTWKAGTEDSSGPTYTFKQGDVLTLTSSSHIDDLSQNALALLSAGFRRITYPAIVRYRITFSFPLVFSIDNKPYTWDNSKSTFALYSSYQGVYSYMSDQELTGYTVQISDDLQNYYISTVIEYIDGDPPEGWGVLAEALYKESTSFVSSYFRFMVEIKEASLGEISGQVEQIIGNLEEIGGSLHDILGDPSDPPPSVVIVAEGVVKDYDDQTRSAKAATGELSTLLKNEYSAEITASANQKFSAMTSTVQPEETANFSAVVSMLMANSTIAIFLGVYALLKVLSNMHRKMGD